MAAARVVVIGGGLAGLAAASRLAARGFEVALLEREPRPGGRAASEREKDFAYEPGAHALASSDLRVLALVERVGLAPELLPLRPLALAQVERGRVYRIHPQSARGVSRIPGVGRLARLRLARLPRLLARLAPVLDRDAPERAGLRDDRSTADFVRLYFGSRVLERWLGPWLSDTAMCEPEDASRVLALRLLAFQRHAWIGSLRGDLSRLARALADPLGARCGAAVRAVEARDGGFVVHHAGPHGEGAVDGDAVVLAVPPREALAVAADLLSAAERDVLGARRDVPAIGVALGLEQPLAAHATRIRVPRREGIPFATAVLEPGVPRARVPEARGLAVLIGPVPARTLDASDEALGSGWVAALDRIRPGASSRVAWTRVHRWVSAVPRFDVGDYRALARLRRAEADARARGRRIYLAGDHLVGPSLEGAVVSGERAAAALAEDFERERG